MTATIIPIRKREVPISEALAEMTLTQADLTVRLAVSKMLTVASPATVRAMLQEIIAECVAK